MRGLRRIKVGLLMGLVSLFLVQGVQAQEESTVSTQQEHVLSEEIEEEKATQDETILEEGEEGEITERGIRRFRFPRTNRPPTSSTRKRIIIPAPPKRPLPPPNTKTFPRDPRKVDPSTRDRFRGRRPMVPPPGSPTKQCVIKASEIVQDLHIDIGDKDRAGESAKQSLFRMLSKGTVAQRRAASSMVMAIRDQRLAGIYQWNKTAVSERSQRLFPPIGPWDLIPKGQLATCLKDPAGEPPMIIYSRQPMHPSVLDNTLLKAWGRCGFPTLPSPCKYVADAVKPIQVEEDEPEQTGNATLVVRVVWKDGDEKSTAANATVRLQGPNSGVLTAPLGEVKFRRLPPGKYNVSGSGVADGAMLVSAQSAVTLESDTKVVVEIWLDRPEEKKVCDSTLQARKDLICDDAKVRGEDRCILQFAHRSRRPGTDLDGLASDWQHQVCINEVHHEFDRCKLESAKLSNCPVTVD